MSANEIQADKLQQAAVIALAALLNQNGKEIIVLLESFGLEEVYYSGEDLEPLAIQKLCDALGIANEQIN